MPSAYSQGLTPEQIDDLVENTLHKFEKDSWVDISTELQRYFAHDNFLLGKRIGVDGGDQLQWQVKVRNTGAAANTGMYAVDDIKVADVMKHCLIPWTKQTTHMAYDIDEPAFNTPNSVRILNLIKTRRHAALTDFAELMESNFWGLPEDPNDTGEMKKPYGVPYWIVRNSTKGFYGQLPQGGNHTTVAGLSPATYENWRNFTGLYRVIDKRDCVRLMREATVKCYFREPVSHPTPGGSGRPRYRITSTYEVIQKMEEILEAQNQSLGNDIASKDGDLIFRRVPVVWVPYLDAHHDVTGAGHFGRNPIYGIDLKAFRMIFKTGAFMRKTKPIIAPNQHSVRHIHWDSWTQFQCLNRRCNWVITQAP